MLVQLGGRKLNQAARFEQALTLLHAISSRKLLHFKVHSLHTLTQTGKIVPIGNNLWSLTLFKVNSSSCHK